MADDIKAQPSPRLSPEDIERWRNPPPPATKTEIELRIEATMDALMRESRVETDKFQEEYYTEHREEFARAALAEEQRRAADIEAIAARTAALVVGALARSRLESASEPPPQLPKPVKQATGSEPDDDQVFTVDQICERNKISRSTFYKHGPVSYKAGKSTRITRREERLWQQRQRKAASHGKGL